MRQGMAPRLALILALLAVLASGLTGYYAYDTSRRLLMDSAEQNLLTATQVLGQRLAASLGETAKDAGLLAHMAQSPEVSEPAMVQASRSLLEAHPEYFQVRFIDARQHGLERIRLDRDGPNITQVTGFELQEKGHKLYVSQALRLEPGQVYLSKIFINKEGGAHSGFERPTLIVATPVAGPRGRVEKLLVINVDLETLFDEIRQEVPPDFEVYLTNEWGDFLIHPDPGKTFGFERGLRFLGQDSFAPMAAIVAGEMESVVVKTAQIGEGKESRKVVAAFHKLQPREFASQRFFILGMSQPLANVLKDNQVLRDNIIHIVLVFSLFSLLLAWLVSRAVTRPLAHILARVRNFAAGREVEPLPMQRRDEIGQLAQGIQDMQLQINQQLEALERNHEAMAYLAHHDALTGLPNRVTFFDRLEVALTQARRQGRQLAVLFVDLDRFKDVNDRYGHQVGDQLLQAVARRLQSGLRESDTAARLAGDEFVVLLTPVLDRNDVLVVADKLLQRFQAPLGLDELVLPIRVSIGISFFPDHGITPQALLEAADVAMYRSKNAGRNTWSVAGEAQPPA